MIEIQQQPDLFSLAGNPIRFGVKGSTAIGKNTSSATIYISVLRELRTSDFFEIVVNGEKKTFRVILWLGSQGDNPTDSYVTADAGDLIVKFINAVVTYLDLYEALKKYSFFTQRFTISLNQDRIQLDAKTQEYYAVTLGNHSHREDLDPINITQWEFGNKVFLRDGYSIHRRIVLLPPHAEELVCDDYVGVDGIGCNDSDFAEYFHEKFSTTLNYPSESIAIVQEKWLLKYKAEFNEKATGFESPICESREFFVIPGRLPNLDYYQQLYSGENNLMSTLGIKFLSNYQGIKMLYKDSPEKLSFLFLETGAYLLRCEIQYLDVEGNDDGFEILDMVTLLIESSQLYEFDVSYTRILSLSEKTNIGNYRVYLMKSGKKISDVRNYTISDCKPDLVKQFFFMNFYGVLELAIFHGVEKTTTNYTRKFSNIDQSNTTLPISVHSENEYTVSSGWLSQNHWHWLQEFQSSLQIYEILQNKVLRCSLRNDKTLEITNNNPLKAHSITYIHLIGDVQSYIPRIFDNTFDNTFI